MPCCSRFSGLSRKNWDMSLMSKPSNPIMIRLLEIGSHLLSTILHPGACRILFFPFCFFISFLCPILFHCSAFLITTMPLLEVIHLGLNEIPTASTHLHHVEFFFSLASASSNRQQLTLLLSALTSPGRGRPFFSAVSYFPFYHVFLT